jgi:hypothetical protein
LEVGRSHPGVNKTISIDLRRLQRNSFKEELSRAALLGFLLVQADVGRTGPEEFHSVGEISKKLSLMIWEELQNSLGDSQVMTLADLDLNRMVLSFQSGRVAGLTCTLAVDGKRINCRMKSESAVLRERLKRTSMTLGRGLASAGLVLGGFEVHS